MFRNNVSRENMFSVGPTIKVYFIVEEGLIQRVSLYASSTPGLKWQMESSQIYSEVEGAIEEWLTKYVSKQQPHCTLPLNWAGTSPFTLHVLHVLQTILFGKTLSYQQVAQLVKNKKASRAVGGACGRNPFPLIIPCHRVLTSKYTLGGFSGGIDLKRRLLHFEDIIL